MPKRHVLVDRTTPAPKQFKPTSTNWELCVLCQNEDAEPLQCPARSTKASIGSGYSSLANHILQFQQLGSMPIDINIERLDDGDGIEATFTTHVARWHKSCCLKFNQIKLDRLQKKSSATSYAGTSATMKRRSSHDIIDLKEPKCFLCDEPAGSTGLHEASTYDIDSRVRRCAMELEDTALLTKLAPGDMIALEAKYHRKCLANLYNKARSAESASAEEDPEARLHGIAFAELVTYMEEFRLEESVSPVFQLSHLAHLYKVCLEQLGAANVEGRIHTTRLKLRLLSVFPDLQAHTQGRGILLMFDDDVSCAVRKACDYDSESMHLARAAQIVRREMFDKKVSFDGSFKQGSEKDAVPQSLLALVNMIQDGPNIKHQNEMVTAASTTSALSISQLLMFNSVKHTRGLDPSGTVRHNRDRETPLPIFIALKIHSVTRSRNLIDTLFGLGICVSYDRFIQLTSDIANGVCQRFQMDDVVCPPKMRHKLFT